MSSTSYVLVDNDFSQSKQIYMPRQIKAREMSFDSIRGNFNNFISKIDRKIEGIKQKGQEIKSDSKSALTVAKAKLARLEEKIKVLSAKFDPVELVHNRPIKLRKHMMENTYLSSGQIYSIGKSEQVPDTMDKVNSSDAMIDNPSRISVPRSGMFDDPKSQKVLKKIVRSGMFDDPDEGKQLHRMVRSGMFDDPEKSKVLKKLVRSGMFDDPKEDGIKKAVRSGMFDDPVEAKALKKIIRSGMFDEPVEQKVLKKIVRSGMFDDPEESKVLKKIVRSGMFDDPDSYEDGKGSVVNVNDLNREIDSELERIKVSKNGSAAKINKYDSKESEKSTPKPKLRLDDSGRVVIVPYDKSVGNVSNGFKSLNISTYLLGDIFTPTPKREHNIETNPELTILNRDMPIIADEKEESESNKYVLQEELEDPIEEFMFDIVSDEYENDSWNANSINSERVDVFSDKKREYELLKGKVQVLTKEKEKIAERKTKAEMSAEETSEAARLSKQERINSIKELDERIQVLRQYTELLEIDCNDDMRKTMVAEKDEEMNRNFININNKKTAENKEIINEIDSIIGQEEKGFSK